MASLKGHESVALALIEAKADVNQVDKVLGLTPLHWAAYHGQQAVVQALIAAGARIDPANQEGTTPLYKALEMDHAEVARILINAGADVNQKDSKGRRPADLMGNRGPAAMMFGLNLTSDLMRALNKAGGKS